MSTRTTQQYYAGLAQKHHLSWISLEALQDGATLLNIDHHVEYMKLQAIPFSETKTTVKIATANLSPQNMQKIRHFFHRKTAKKIELAVASRQDITTTLAHRFKKEYLRRITHGRDDADLLHSASYTFTRTEKIILIAPLLI